ncbi:SDR family oxidoreductase [Anaeromyxobacter oryzae]|uniref:Short-chain dehydrogenase n=1 Tax=Anaeromyxobacter oryzae TaxID=2918170 RepID=A0ABM7WUR5_9BACT|nr:SDR family oxidoreductase [Anaeromyxobacter oryzae]BDG03130.1 short-chain dehydrogenase [Anaeromyxobacter oryzae]
MSTHGAVLVTGASSGMGKACALRLSEGGFTVFAAVRKQRDAQALGESGSPRLVPVILDVTRGETISEAVRTVRDAVGASGLAGLVNNAGVAVTGPIELVPLEELRRQFEINVFGQVAVTQAFLPLIRAARGRIVNVGSVGAKFALPFSGALNASKAAFELISDSLRMELRPWGIHVVLVSPGSIRTTAEAKLVADSEGVLRSFSAEGKARYASSYRAFIQAFQELESRGVGPGVMAETVYRALTARVPRRRYPVGPKARLLPFLFTRLPAAAADALRLRLLHVYRAFGAAAEQGGA